MYIFELLSTTFEKIKKRDFRFLKKKSPAPQVEEEQKCEHIFVPIDSTKKILACSRCGFMVKVDPEKFKKQNFFKKDMPDK